jgi:hypothetical protein
MHPAVFVAPFKIFPENSKEINRNLLKVCYNTDAAEFVEGRACAVYLSEGCKAAFFA